MARGEDSAISFFHVSLDLLGGGRLRANAFCYASLRGEETKGVRKNRLRPCTPRIRFEDNAKFLR